MWRSLSKYWEQKKSLSQQTHAETGFLAYWFTCSAPVSTLVACIFMHCWKTKLLAFTSACFLVNLHVLSMSTPASKLPESCQLETKGCINWSFGASALNGPVLFRCFLCQFDSLGCTPDDALSSIYAERVLVHFQASLWSTLTEGASVQKFCVEWEKHFWGESCTCPHILCFRSCHRTLRAHKLNASWMKLL